MHKKIISAVLALTLTFGAAGLPAAESGIFTESGIAVSANAATYGDYEYELLDDGTVEISKYIGSDTTAKIPSKINGKDVTSFSTFTFDECKNLTNITVDKDNKYFTSEDGVLFNKEKTELIAYPHGNTRKSYVIPDGVTKIAGDAFFESDYITSITIPGSVKKIDYWSFTGCSNLKTLTLSEGLESIGDFAFYCCGKLQSVTIPKSVTSVGIYSLGYDMSNTGLFIVDGFKMNCYSGSVAVQYAKDNGLDYELIDSSGVSVDRVTTNGFTSKTNSVTIMWNKVSGASGYRIYKYNTSTKKWSTLTTVKNGNTLSYTQSGLKAGTVYKYKVKAYTKKNGSTTWGESSETLKTATTPAKTVISSAKAAKTAVKLNWNKVNGADGYKVQQYVGGKWTTVKTVDSSTATYKVTGLKKGTAYKFRIRAFKKVGGKTLFGAYSAEKKVTTKK